MTRVAAIDCGTNSIRLLVADVTAAGLRSVVRRMEIVRLGAGVDATGQLSAAAIERTRVVLADYAGQLRDLGARRVRMVATSASRDVSNRSDFEAMVVATLGQPPEVISGDEEAHLSFAGATRGLPAAEHHRPDGTAFDPPYLVVDIGGGSTEFVLGDRAVTAAASVDIGCVRLTERHLHSDPPTTGEVEAARADISAGIARAAQAVDLDAARTLLGLAGSVTTVAALALGLTTYDPDRVHHARIPYADVDRVTSMLLAAPRAQRAALPMMHPGRVDVIGAGALILRTVMARTNLPSVVPSEHDILDGIAYSMV